MAITVSVLGCTVETNVDCSSNNFQDNTCVVPGTRNAAYTSIKVFEQISTSACKKGESYGFLNGAVWVKNGCRAKFQICSCKNHVSLKCESQNNAYKECSVANTNQVTHVDVQTQHSTTTCTTDVNFGPSSSSVYVAKGCRATFNVCYR